MPLPESARRGHGLIVLVALLVLCLTGCKQDSPSPSATTTPEASPTETTSATATATPRFAPTPAPGSTPSAAPTPPAKPEARPFQPDVRQAAEAIVKRTAELHGTPSKAPIEMNLISRKAAIDYYRDANEPEDIEQMKRQEEIYKLLGLIPESSDLQALFLGLLGLGITGFYEPKLDAFYLLDDLGGIDSPASRNTIVHELTHALQDQYYDLDAIQDALRYDWDGGMAFLQLVEGDAVATETLYYGTSLRTKPGCFLIPPPARFGGLPYIIQRELNSWYDDGVCFVDAVRARVPNGVISLFDNPPKSTEQTLHPEKYLAQETPKAVTVPSVATALGPDWTELTRSSFGEFNLQNLLVVGLNETSVVAEAAAGWAGDTWALYGRGDIRLWQYTVDWDTPADVQQFWTALTRSLSGRPDASQRMTTADSLRFDVGTTSWRATLRNDEIQILVSNDAAALARAATQLGLP